MLKWNRTAAFAWIFFLARFKNMLNDLGYTDNLCHRKHKNHKSFQCMETCRVSRVAALFIKPQAVPPKLPSNTPVYFPSSHSSV